MSKKKKSSARTQARRAAHAERRRGGQRAHATPNKQSATASIEIDRPLVTQRMIYTMVPNFPNGDPRNVLTNAAAGSPGRYRVTIVLAVPGRNVVQDAVPMHAAVEAGDSMLALPLGVHEIHVALSASGDGPHVKVRGNTENRLRDLSVEIDASGFDEASQIGHDVAMPLLSRWSYLHNVAITTSGTLVEQLATGSARMYSTLIGAVKGFSDLGEFVSSPEHRQLLASYREGLSSTEPLYQALSLYKVGEGVWKLRDRRSDAVRAAGATPSEASERVPGDVSNLGDPAQPIENEALAHSLTPYAGKKYRAAFDDIKKRLRNNIAHLDPEMNPFAQDNWQDVERVYEVLPALRWMSRNLIEAELDAKA